MNRRSNCIWVSCLLVGFLILAGCSKNDSRRKGKLCSGQAECGDGYCVESACVALRACVTSSDCGDGICDQRVCWSEKCETTDDCETGRCIEKRCVARLSESGESAPQSKYYSDTGQITECTDDGSCKSAFKTVGTCQALKCTGGICVRDSKSGGVTCDDGLFCTVGDVCDDNGQCSGKPKDCASNTSVCSDGGVCDEDNERCGKPKPKDTPCDDEFFCTTGNTCDGAGKCVPGQQKKDCSSADGPCATGICDETSKSCKAQPKAKGTTCDDALFCTLGDVCDDKGVCQPSKTARDCSVESDACNDSKCNEDKGICEKKPKKVDTSCEDVFFCTSGDKCDDKGVCQPGKTVRDCTGKSDACNEGECNEDKDLCEKKPKKAETSCEDEFFCSIGDKCNADGECKPGTETRDCSAGGQCTVLGCDEVKKLCGAPKEKGVQCDNQDICTTNDECDGKGKCVGEPDMGRRCPLDKEVKYGVCDFSGGCQPFEVQSVPSPGTPDGPVVVGHLSPRMCLGADDKVHLISATNIRLDGVDSTVFGVYTVDGNSISLSGTTAAATIGTTTNPGLSFAKGIVMACDSQHFFVSTPGSKAAIVQVKSLRNGGWVDDTKLKDALGKVLIAGVPFQAVFSSFTADRQNDVVSFIGASQPIVEDTDRALIRCTTNKPIDSNPTTCEAITHPTTSSGNSIVSDIVGFYQRTDDTERLQIRMLHHIGSPLSSAGSWSVFDLQRTFSESTWSGVPSSGGPLGCVGGPTENPSRCFHPFGLIGYNFFGAPDQTAGFQDMYGSSAKDLWLVGESRDPIILRGANSEDGIENAKLTVGVMLHNDGTGWVNSAPFPPKNRNTGATTPLYGDYAFRNVWSSATGDWVAVFGIYRQCQNPGDATTCDFASKIEVRTFPFALFYFPKRNAGERWSKLIPMDVLTVTTCCDSKATSEECVKGLVRRCDVAPSQITAAPNAVVATDDNDALTFYILGHKFDASLVTPSTEDLSAGLKPTLWKLRLPKQSN